MLWEVPKKDCHFTWTNKRKGFSHIAKRLDIIFLSGEWQTLPIVFEGRIMELSGSEHYPVSMVVQNDGIPIRCPFKFKLMWFREEGFFDKVLNWWASASPVEGNATF